MGLGGLGRQACALFPMAPLCLAALRALGTRLITVLDFLSRWTCLGPSNTLRWQTTYPMDDASKDALMVFVVVCICFRPPGPPGPAATHAASSHSRHSPIFPWSLHYDVVGRNGRVRPLIRKCGCLSSLEARSCVIGELLSIGVNSWMFRREGEDSIS